MRPRSGRPINPLGVDLLGQGEQGPGPEAPERREAAPGAPVGADAELSRQKPDLGRRSGPRGHVVAARGATLPAGLPSAAPPARAGELDEVPPGAGLPNR